MAWSPLVITVPPIATTWDTAAAAPEMTTKPFPVMVTAPAATPRDRTVSLKYAYHEALVTVPTANVVDAPSALLVAGVPDCPNVGLKMIVGAAVAEMIPPASRQRILPARRENAGVNVHSAGSHRLVRVNVLPTAVWDAGGASAPSRPVNV